MKREPMVLGLIMLISALSVASAETMPLTVVGEGAVSVPADTVTISITVTSSNENTTQAIRENSDRLNRTVQALIDAGLSRDDIRQGYSNSIMSGQMYSRICRTVNNTTVCDVQDYNATNQVKSQALVRMMTTDQSEVNSAMEAARSEEASAEIIGYSLSDSNSAVSEARQKALEDAKNSAQEIATFFGMRLGNVIEVSNCAYSDVGRGFFWGMGMPQFYSDGFGFDGFGFGRPDMITVRSCVRVSYSILE